MSGGSLGKPWKRRVECSRVGGFTAAQKGRKVLVQIAGVSLVR